MSTIRVYELAKEMGVDTKTLIARMREETSIEVDEHLHLTVLGPEEVARIRGLFEQPREGDIVQKRISSTVIRRRTRRRPGSDGPDTGEAGEPESLESEPAPAAVVEPVPPPEPAPVTEPEPPPVIATVEEPVPEAPEPVEADPVEAETTPVAQPEPVPATPETEPAQAETPPVVEEAVVATEPDRPTPSEQAEVAPVAPAVAVDETKESQELAETDGDAEASDRRPGPLYKDAKVTTRIADSEGPRAKVLDRIEIPKERPAPVRPARPAPVRPARPGPPPGRRDPFPSAGVVPPPVGPAPGKDVGRRRATTGRRVYDRRGEQGSTWSDGPAGGLGGRGKRRKPKGMKMTRPAPLSVPKAAKRVVRMGELVTVADLASQLSIKSGEIIMKLMDLGVMATINQAVDFDTATLIAQDYEFTVENIAFEEANYIEEQTDSAEDLESRAPVVTIMGHVDHGKTSLLDAIQHTRIADRESGGITQHIGAYTVDLPTGRVTFVDTPGHEAFTAMRARGAQVTDLVVLVVAADDGVMPQTIEAINHARAAEVPIVVAVNKIDKDNADPTRVRQALTEYELVDEAWGGETIFVDVSAKQKIGIDTLLEMLVVQAEMLDLRANPNKQAKGVVIEAKLDTRRGPVATLLVQEGTLRTGDIVVSGAVQGRVRRMLDDHGKNILEAGPSTPVEVTGLSDVPVASDAFNVVKDEKTARTLVEHRSAKARESKLASSARTSLDSLFTQMQKGETKELKIILKADVQGSIEAIQNALTRLSNDEVEVRVVHTGVGGITENDVNLASASNLIIIGFNVRPEVKAKALAEQEGVELNLYSVIYDAVEDVKAALTGMLSPTKKEVVLGHAQVREIFHIPKVGAVSGVMVVDGRVVRGSQVRLVRDSVVVWQGRMSSLRRFKEDVKEVREGYECGIGLDGYNDIKLGDVIESFEIQEVAATL